LLWQSTSAKIRPGPPGDCPFGLPTAARVDGGDDVSDGVVVEPVDQVHEFAVQAVCRSSPK
jgi:hypothetical protein